MKPVAALVVFKEGEKESRLYRKYKIRLLIPPDDYGCMREVLMRRYRNAKRWRRSARSDYGRWRKRPSKCRFKGLARASTLFPSTSFLLQKKRGGMIRE